MERSEPDAPASQTDSLAGSALHAAGLTDLLRPPARSAAAAAADIEPGARLGDVVIVRLVGEGGMGSVYEGLQGMPCRTVAVKVIRPGLLSPPAAKRFEYEAQILGRLTHPGIARIYTVGMQQLPGCAVPYFVMEYVEDALAVTTYATRHDLSTRDRVTLFREVCRAVAHGHQRGVIHRDLKPGNILVDVHGHPKIIDFGVARSTDGDVALTTMHTDIGQLVGTIQYMCPEQFDGTSDDLDVRADVYSLGVVLYELLAGRPPYDLRSRAVYEVARVVKDVAPKSLSTVNPKLRGDLDTIVAKSLEKDRGRRYSSATELEADLGRYLRGEPILASPPRLLESVVRLGRRHKVAALAAAGVMAALMIAVVGISIFALRADAASREAIRQLYVSNLRSLRACLDARNLRMARQLCVENAAIAGTPLPLEMRVLAAGVDESLVAIGLGQGPVSDLAYSPDGSVLGAVIAVPKRASETSRAFLIHHRSFTNSIKENLLFFSAGDRQGYGRLAACDEDWVRGWRGHAGLVKTVGDDGDASLMPVAISPDGRWMAVHARDGGVRLVDRSMGREEVVLTGHRGRLKQVAFSPDGSRVVIHHTTGSLGLWDAGSGGFMAWCGGEHACIMQFQFSPDGARLAAVVPRGKSYGVFVHDTGSGRMLSKMSRPRGLDPSDSFMVTAFSPDGDHLVTTGDENDVHAWDVMKGDLLASLRGHSADVTAVAFSPDGGQIASGAANGHVRLWNSRTFAQEREFMGHDGATMALAFRPDGETLASGSHDGTVRIWSRTAAEPLAVLAGVRGMTAVAFSPDGRQLAVAPRDGGGVELWDPQTVKRLFTLGGTDGVVSQLAYSPDGALVAAAVKSSSENGTARIWRTDNGELLSALDGHVRGAKTVTFSPDGSRLATTSGDGVARVWNPRTADMLMASSADRGSQAVDVAAAFGLEGTRLAFKKTELLDAATGRVVVDMGPRGQVTCLAASPDGRVLAAGTAIGAVYLNDFVTGRLISRLKGHHDAVWSIAFVPEGHRLLTGSLDGTARLWDARSGRELRVFRGHEGRVEKLLVSPDGRRVVTAATDGTVRIWDMDSGYELCSLPGQMDLPQSLALSPDGTVLVTANAQGTVKIQGLSNAAITAARGAVSGPR